MEKKDDSINREPCWVRIETSSMDRSPDTKVEILGKVQGSPGVTKLFFLERSKMTLTEFQSLV